MNKDEEWYNVQSVWLTDRVDRDGEDRQGRPCAVSHTRWKAVENFTFFVDLQDRVDKNTCGLRDLLSCAGV